MTMSFIIWSLVFWMLMVRVVLPPYFKIWSPRVYPVITSPPVDSIVCLAFRRTEKVVSSETCLSSYS